MATNETKIDEKIREVHKELNKRISKASPLLSYLRQRIEDYSSKRKFAKVVIQGSVRNDLYFPEILKDGVYRVEIDLLFEQDQENITLPLAYDYLNVPQVMVEPVPDETVSSPLYVKLKFTGFPECLRKTEKSQFLKLDDKSGKYHLKNSEYLNSLPSTEDEIQGGIMGEKEISTGGGVFSFNGRIPFKAFKTAQTQQLVTDEETLSYHVLMDKVAAIKVKWPVLFSSWETRERVWPSLEVCKEITQYGIHVIPKSSHLSESVIQWKYTFAIAEQRLAHTFTPFQKTCYLILKQLKRKYFSQVSLQDGALVIASGISTHHLKTVMFWTSEKINPSEWQNNPGKCLSLLVQMLVDFLQSKHCPSYFVPEVNLFERLWMDETKFMYVRDYDQLRDMRLQTVLKLVLEVQLNIKEYITSELLQVVDDAHDRVASDSEFAEGSIISGWKFKMAKEFASVDFPFTLDYRDLFEVTQEEKEEKDEL
nr:mab-21-D2 [Haliclona caerulea]